MDLKWDILLFLLHITFKYQKNMDKIRQICYMGSVNS